jgi:anti-anti-sigma regulatory factor
LLRIVRTTDPPGLFDDIADTDTRITVDMNELRFADTAAVHLLLRAAHASPAGLSLVGLS